MEGARRDDEDGEDRMQGNKVRERVVLEGSEDPRTDGGRRRRERGEARDGTVGGHAGGGEGGRESGCGLGRALAEPQVCFDPLRGRDIG